MQHISSKFVDTVIVSRFVFRLHLYQVIQNMLWFTEFDPSEYIILFHLAKSK